MDELINPLIDPAPPLPSRALPTPGPAPESVDVAVSPTDPAVPPLDPEEPPVDLSASLRRKKWATLGVMLVLATVAGAADGFYAVVPGGSDNSMTYQLVRFCSLASFMICLGVWCSYDSEQHGFRLSRYLRWTVVLLAVVGIPIYAFRSRGRGGWRLLGQAFLFYLLIAFVYASAGGVAGWVEMAGRR